MTFSNVDLPAPDLPIMDIYSHFLTFKFKSFKICLLPNFTLIFFASIIVDNCFVI